MKITQKQIVWVLVALAVIAAGYWAYREFSWMLKKRDLTPPAPNKGDNTNGDSKSLYSKGDGFPLEKYSNGARVLELQKAMNRAIDLFNLSTAKITEDGKLGPATIALMSKFKIDVPIPDQSYYNNALAVLNTPKLGLNV